MLHALLWLSLAAHADQSAPISGKTRARLPNDVIVEVRDGALWVARDGPRGRLPPPEDWPGWRAPVTALTQVMVTDNKTLVSIHFKDECGNEDELRMTMNSLLARGHEASGREALERGDFASAAKLFARAAQTDPEFAEAALGEASALSRAGKQDAALEALDALISKEPAAVYLRLLADPELQPLLNGARLVSLRATVPGSARLELDEVLKGGGEFAPGKPAAFESVRRLAAGVARVVDAPEPSEDPEERENPKYRWHSTFYIVETRTGRALLSWPLVLADETEVSTSVVHWRPALAAKKKAIAARVELANRALSDLGLSVPDQIKGARQTAAEAPASLSTFSFPNTPMRLMASSGGSAELFDASTPRGPSRDEGPERLEWAVWLPGPRLAVYQWGQFPGEGCPKNVYEGVGVLRF